MGKEYICFQIEGKSAQAAKCVKTRIMTKVVDFVLSINTFEQQCVVLKSMLQSTHLQYHTNTIMIDQSLSNSAIFQIRYLENIKKLYQHSGKCDEQKLFKDIL